MKIFGDSGSRNCYKIKLLAASLEIQHGWTHVDILAGGTKTPEFLNKNPNSKISIVGLTEGRCRSESNAIVDSLASGSSLVSSDPYEYAKVKIGSFWSNTAMSHPWPFAHRLDEVHGKVFGPTR